MNPNPFESMQQIGGVPAAARRGNRRSGPATDEAPQPPPGLVGYGAEVRRGVVQINFGCQSVMIYPGAGAVEILSPYDLRWNLVTPEAAEALGNVLLEAAASARHTRSAVPRRITRSRQQRRPGPERRQGGE